jgi:hypothetical protein
MDGGKNTMKKLLLALIVLLMASFAIAANPAITVSVDATGNAVLKPDLPKGQPYNWKFIGIGENKILCLVWAEGDRAKIAVYNCDFADLDENPTPDPKPDPKPDPIPIPPTPVAKAWGMVIVYESKTNTAAQGQAITSKALSEAIASKGLKLSPFDKDAVDETGKEIPNLKAWNAKAKSLPYFFVPDVNGNTIDEGTFSNEDDLLNVVKEVK